ncbi:MAG: ComEC/Rec2 family competence protein [Treponema sp.]|jgi:competence protein ComEC|nr:ComEC/Rec2 family competence protein [Treponema sp.]
MVARVKFPPVLGLVAGAVLGYYGFHFIRNGISGSGILGLLFFLVLPLCLFRVLARFPGEFSAASRRRFYVLGEQYMSVFSLGLVLGLGSGGAVPRGLSLGLPVEDITGISGVLLDDPRILSGGRGLGTLSLRGAAGGGGIRSSARGEISVFFPDETAPRLKEFGRKSLVFVEGSLVSGDAGTLFPGEKNLLFRASAVHIVQPSPALEQFRTGLRMEIGRRFGAGAWGGLALALLLGIRDNLDTGLAGLYQNAGCSHILALSGMHLAIISSLIAFCLKKPLGLRAAAIAGAVFIALYVFLVGSQPSLNRAALMYFLGTLAILGALPRRPGSLLGLAFLIQIILWPGSGLSISFILSYLALAGILVVGEALHEIFRGKIPPLVLQPLAASVGAFLATAGVTAFFFGALRPAGILAGFIIVPLTSLFMIASMIWLVLDLLFPPLSLLLGQGISLLYLLMDLLVSLAARLPGISVPRPILALGLSLGVSALVVWLGNRFGLLKRRLPSFV